MKAKNVDAILVFGAPTDAITLVRQMKEIGLNVKYMHGWKCTWTGEFMESLGEDSNYVICDGFWSEDYLYPGAKELGDRYHKKFNKYSVSKGCFYATAQILLRAIEAAGSLDSAKVRKAIIETKFKGTVMGDIDYDERGLALISSTANQWWNGKQMWFYPVMEGGWKLKMMPPWDKR